MKLTKTIIERAKTNAEMTGHARLILSGFGALFDTDDTAASRRYAKKCKFSIEAVVHWDGTVDRPKKRKARRPK